MKVFVLTHAFSDNSGFHICGATTNYAMAETWFNANQENDIYAIDLEDAQTTWNDAISGWRRP